MTGSRVGGTGGSVDVGLGRSDNLGSIDMGAGSSALRGSTGIAGAMTSATVKTPAPIVTSNNSVTNARTALPLAA